MHEFHTHTFRCKHAEGDIADFAKYASSRGYSILGVSDHTPFPDNCCSEIRMDISELKDYVEAYREAQIKFPDIKILLGMECEYFDKYRDFYKDVLINMWGFDYLILGQHIFLCDGKLNYFWKGMLGVKELWAYTNHVVRGIESDIFSIVAHPDVFGSFYDLWDEEAISCSRYILEAAQAYGIPVEINGNGYRKGKRDIGRVERYLYPLEQFWKLASEYNITVVVDSDAHKPSELAAVKEGWELVDKYKLKVAEPSDILIKRSDADSKR